MRLKKLEKMKLGICQVLLVVLLLPICSAVTDKEFLDLKTQIVKLLKTQKDVIASLARQVSQQQLHVEEMTRSSGDSGLKLIRLTRSGSKPYQSTSYADFRFAAIHGHPNYRGTVGLGEIVAVLNGVEFRTRHNDYKMKMPSLSSSEYGASEDVPYPEVPPEVLAQPSLDLQIEEMREWFKAWKTSNHSVRDYRRYFKPNLCYLEGQWTNVDGEAIDEPFHSERHHLDADSFFDLQDKIKYTSQTGRKSNLENYAYLPTTISHINEMGGIQYSQWNYQILCHPITEVDVPLTAFQVEDDLGSRLAEKKALSEFSKKRAARFSLKEPNENVNQATGFTKINKGSMLDKLMSQIPGKDNYPANVVDDLFNEIAYPHQLKVSRDNFNSSILKPLNAGYYHRFYQVLSKDAMGVNIFRRGFSDNNLFVAYNTRSKVTPTKVKEKCKPKDNCPSNWREASHRVSYAIPLEIIYTTPLQTWNPYNLTFFNESNVRGPAAENSFGKKRNGGNTNDTAYLGYSERFYTLTPLKFYDVANFYRDSADTTKKKGVGVLDQQGNVRRVVASGINIMTRDIPGIGAMRIRYPIMPLHDTGSSIYKDLKALAELTLNKEENAQFYPGAETSNDTFADEVFLFETSPSTRNPPGFHVHTVELTRLQIKEMKLGKQVSVMTSEDAGHSHNLVLKWTARRDSIKIYECDSSGEKTCWDGHRGDITCMDCQDSDLSS